MINNYLVILIHLIFIYSAVRAGALPEDNTHRGIGLYDSDDKVKILNKDNFKAQLYNKNHGWLIQFYNTYCGHCQRFAPTFKDFAREVYNWKHFIKLGVLDCSDEANTDICREFEIEGYPTIKYFHVNYPKGKNYGTKFPPSFTTVSVLKQLLIDNMKREQNEERIENWPNLIPSKYNNLAETWAELPPHVKVVFLLFVKDNDTTGSEVVLDLDTVFGVKVRLVSADTILAKSRDIKTFPNLLAVRRDLETTTLTPKEPTRYNLRKAILVYLQSKSISIPDQLFQDTLNETEEEPGSYINQSETDNSPREIGDVVYQADIETGLKYMLQHEFTAHKIMDGERLIALKNLLFVFLKYFPFSPKGKSFMSELYEEVLKEKEVKGKNFAVMIKNLEEKHSPVFDSAGDYIGCNGSEAKYRGYTCSVWTIFHLLTVNSAQHHSTDPTQVLKAMFGYAKYFLGCTECSEHFQKMAKDNNLESVAENDGAILWLWIAHNTVNHRLAGDETEDPAFPKRQYPIKENCPKCHRNDGMWDFQEVLYYLKTVYDIKNINITGGVPHSIQSSPFSNIDMTLIILLYVCCAIMLVFVLRLFLNKRYYKKKSYAHDVMGKV